MAIIGHNSAGKSTLLKAVFGLIPVWKGEISYNGEAVKNWSPAEKVRKGMAYVPQGNRVFSERRYKKISKRQPTRLMAKLRWKKK